MPPETDIPWPGGARCAVMLTFDLDAELIWLDLDASVENRLATRSIGEYGPRRGVGRILDVLADHGLVTSWMVPGLNVVNYPDVLRAIHEQGHEIGNHGWRHENFGTLTPAEQRDALLRANEAIENLTGRPPVGYRTPAGEVTPETVELLIEQGFEWTSFTRADDRPYFLELDGKPTDVVEIPPHWDLDDFPYFMYNRVPAFPKGQSRIASYTQVLESWKIEFDAYYDLGLCYVIMFHPQAIGTPGRIRILERLIEHMQNKDDVWFATGAEVADWWRGLRRPNEPGHPDYVFATAARG